MRSKMKTRKRVDKAKPSFPEGLPATSPEQFDAGATIFSQGDKCTAVHYIQQGVVKLTLVSSRGRAGVLGFLGRGDFFGENCIRSRTFYSTSAVALVPSLIMVISRDKMLKIIEEEPSVCSRFITYLLGRNHRIEQDLIDHLFNSSEKRLARTVLLLAADVRGITRPRVNLFMNKFRKAGYIHYDKNGRLEVYKSLAKVLTD